MKNFAFKTILFIFPQQVRGTLPRLLASMDALTTALLFLICGIAIGGLISWWMAKVRWEGQAILRRDLPQTHVVLEQYEQVQQQLRLFQELAHRKDLELRDLSAQLAARQQLTQHLEEKLTHQQEEMLVLQRRMHLEFEQLANRLLEEKSAKFTQHNQQQVEQLLTPLREKILQFESGIEKRFIEETRDRVSLKKEIEQLRELNQQLSRDAHSLTTALKGDNKLQGDWGEAQLELLLEKAGLERGLHYQAQKAYTDAAGKIKKPDFIIFLPHQKHLILDAKVSLLAYQRYTAATTEPERQVALREHLDSLRRHVRDLSEKNYPQLTSLNAPDYVMLFVPIEPAFTLAMQHDHPLFTDALDKNIVMVTNSTLLATLRTISFIWKQEKQKNNVLEIARQSGLLYDKFCAFIEDLKGIGQRIEQTQLVYREAMNKLVDSTRFGDTLVGRAEKIKKLGAKTTKQLPLDWQESAPENEVLPPPSSAE